MSQTPGPSTRLRSSRQNTPLPVTAPPGTKQKPTALPAASVGISSGYGAPGKPVIRTQIATETTNLTTLLQNAREPPPAIEEEQADADAIGVAAQASKTTSRRAPGRPSTATRRQRATGSLLNGDADLLPQPRRVPSRLAEVPPADMSMNGDGDGTALRNATFIDHNAGYGGRGGVPDYEPGNIALAAHTLPRYIPQVLRDFNKDLWSFLKAVGAICLIVISTLLALASIFSVCYGLAFTVGAVYKGSSIGSHLAAWTGRSATPPLTEMERMWIEFRSAHDQRELLRDQDLNKTRVDFLQSVAIRMLEGRMSEWDRIHTLNEKTMKRLERMLPSDMAAEMVDGHLVIPDRFWQALQDKLTNNGSALWRAFLDSNWDGVQEVTDKRVANSLANLKNQKQIVSPADFAEAVGKNYAYMESHFKEEMRTAERTMVADFRRVASESASDAVATKMTDLFSSSQLELLAKANQVRNTYEALRQVNFFSPGHGARAVPVNTSPTYTKGKNSWQKWFYPAHPPIAALQRWEEATDCWCATPSTDMGNAQLTVKMGHTIFPDKLIIEHIPSQGTLNISTAPRELEIWIEKPVNSPNTAEQMRETMREQGISSDYCGTPPSNNHVCIGAGKYDIHTQNTVQSIPMFVDTSLLGLAAKTMTIRVSKNWGGEATCLYRLRMTGARVEPTS
ncbi:hypothetical protein LTS14_001733 [Recurvomyces mirabilis]|uniref:uncharacterized protein n=1 Tax=Recurvomyces mirabilis TaxID=574656 RepID=UPI002DE09764|nr:hypothetical protein LTS14_001733 [Recurvomyces mirabilis]